MKILLTGATGFIGSAFAKLAISRGHRIFPIQRPWPRTRVYIADCFVHAGWITTPGEYLESPDNLVCLSDSLKLIDHLRARCQVKHIVSLGTCLETVSMTTYARCKNELHWQLSAGGPIAWCRIFYPYGNGEHPSRLCSSIIHTLNQNQKFTLKNPSEIRDYIHIQDVSRVLLSIVQKKGTGTFDVGTGSGVRIRGLALMLGDLMKKSDMIIDPSPNSEVRSQPIIADRNFIPPLDDGFMTLKEGLRTMLPP